MRTDQVRTRSDLHLKIIKRLEIKTKIFQIGMFVSLQLLKLSEKYYVVE